MESSPPVSGHAHDTLAALLTEIIQCYFVLRANIEGQGLVEDWASGSLALLRTLETGTPKNMADIARDRGVSRQYIQKLVAELKVQGWVSLQADPADKRARRVVITPAGKSFLQETMARMLQFVQGLSPVASTETLSSTREVLSMLRSRLESSS